MLPEYAQARKVVWDAINPHTGIRRIDEAFPVALRASTREQEMFIKFKIGSTWQVVGSDNYNSLIGSPPAGVVYSEWSTAKPQADAFLMPILAENNGWSLYIYTPRGRNHGLTTLQSAQSDPDAFAQVLTVEDTGVMPAERLRKELKLYQEKFGIDQGLAYYEQEYLCSFNAANLGAILGRDIERAERDGRITDEVEIDAEGAPIEISSDIGFRDTASWWFWQPKLAGFSVVDYDGDSGLDADDWVERIEARLSERGAKLGRIWLPHDARSKTFQSKHTSLERFIKRFGMERVRLVPQTSKLDRINAARVVVGHCAFHATRCEKGLAGLREWSFEWDEDLKEFSKEPLHNWASHPGDAFSYGAQIMRERTLEPEEPRGKTLMIGEQNVMTLDELYEAQERFSEEGRV